MICEHPRVSPLADIAAFVAGRPLASRAAEWAAVAHEGQLREVDGAPFLLHCLEVALLLHVAGEADDIIAAGLLHDAVEKSAVTIDAVEDALGPDVAAIVADLTEDPRIARHAARKADLRRRAETADDDTLVVFAADKIAKARELRSAAAADRLTAREVATRRAHYASCLEVLERRLPCHPLTDTLRFELAAQVRIPALAWLASADVPAPAPAALA